MTSVVSIGNKALIYLGNASLIESLSENSVEASLINELYDEARIQTLEGYDWTFARKRQTLSSHADDPPDGVWAYRYQYPADCIQFRRIVNPLSPHTSDQIPFTIEPSLDMTAKTILTNLDEAVGAYTFNQESTNMFSKHFIETLAHLLAHQMAMPLTGRGDLKEAMLSMYAAMLRMAHSVDANEEVKEAPRDTDWVRMREYNTGTYYSQYPY